MRVLIVLAAAAVLVVGFALARPDDDDETSAPTTTAAATTATTTESAPTTTAPTTTAEPEPEVTRIVVRVRGGRPLGGIARATANQGDRVVVTVGSDVADHVHVHGYDLFADVAPGAPARIAFAANLTGRFEIELEDRGEQIAQLTVVP